MRNRAPSRPDSTGLCRISYTYFYEKALFVKPTWRLLLVAEAQLLCTLRALCFYPHSRGAPFW
jgi:hypothetical protein